MKSVQDPCPLKRAGQYLYPRQASECLPVIYGDLSNPPEGSGLWKAVCIDTKSFVYALAGTPLLSQEHGNNVRLFDRYGVEVFDFAFNPAHDFQGQGPMATVTLYEDMRSREPLSAAAQGRAGADGLLGNPIDVLRDFLLNLAGLEKTQLDGASWAKAWRVAQEQGYQAGGVIDRDQAIGSTLSQVLGCFLGSWWLDAAGRLRVWLEGGGLRCPEGEVAHSFAANDTLDAQIASDIKNTCNRVACQYAYNWFQQDYAAYDDGETNKDLLSQSLYLDQPRQLKLPWVQLPQVASQVQAMAVRRFSGSARIISLEVPGAPALHLEKGDYAWFSSAWLRDSIGRTMSDELVRVFALETDLDNRATRFSLEDTGIYRTSAWLADGARQADGAVMAGGDPAGGS